MKHSLPGRTRGASAFELIIAVAVVAISGVLALYSVDTRKADSASVERAYAAAQLQSNVLAAQQAVAASPEVPTRAPCAAGPEREQLVPTMGVPQNAAQSPRWMAEPDCVAAAEPPEAQAPIR